MAILASLKKKPLINVVTFTSNVRSVKLEVKLTFTGKGKCLNFVILSCIAWFS